MSVTQYNIYSYVKGVNGFGLPVSNTIYSATLAANTEQLLTVPSGAAMGAPSANQYNKFIAVIESVSPVFLAVNQTVAVPAGAAFAATTSTLASFSSGYYTKSGDVLHFISPSATNHITVSFYAIQEG